MVDLLMTSLWLISVIRCPGPSPCVLQVAPYKRPPETSLRWWLSHWVSYGSYSWLLSTSSMAPLWLHFGSLLPKGFYYLSRPSWLSFLSLLSASPILIWLPAAHCSFLPIFFALGLHTALTSLSPSVWLYGSLWLSNGSSVAPLPWLPLAPLFY